MYINDLTILDLNISKVSFVHISQVFVIKIFIQFREYVEYCRVLFSKGKQDNIMNTLTKHI